MIILVVEVGFTKQLSFAEAKTWTLLSGYAQPP